MTDPRDTTPEALAVQREVFRRMTPSQRLHAALEMSDEVRAVTESGIRLRHPEYTPEEVRAELIRILAGNALP